MKKLYNIILSLIVVGLLQSVMYGQITITRSLYESNYSNKEWVIIGDTLSGSWDLGSPSSSLQTWNFNSLSISAGAAKDTMPYLTAAGQHMADSFPGADIYSNTSFSMPLSTYILTQSFGAFYSAEDDGIFVLGYALRQQLSPPPPPGFPFVEDTTTIQKYHPKGLAVPLPMTLGTTRTATDSILDPGNELEIESKSFTADAFGTVILPGGRSVQAIRYIRDQTETDIDLENDEVEYKPKERQIVFLCEDLTELVFEVDTTFTGGSTTVLEYRYSFPYGAVGVREISNIAPETFQLNQNYPNPFNPNTNFEFHVAERGLVTLKVYNIIGEEVATLMNREVSPGTYQATWDASGMPSGVYVYRLTAGSRAFTRKMVLAK